MKPLIKIDENMLKQTDWLIVHAYRETWKMRGSFESVMTPFLTMACQGDKVKAEMNTNADPFSRTLINTNDTWLRQKLSF